MVPLRRPAGHPRAGADGVRPLRHHRPPRPPPATGARAAYSQDAPTRPIARPRCVPSWMPATRVVEPGPRASAHVASGRHRPSCRPAPGHRPAGEPRGGDAVKRAQFTARRRRRRRASRAPAPGSRVDDGGRRRPRRRLPREAARRDRPRRAVQARPDPAPGPPRTGDDAPRRPPRARCCRAASAPSLIRRVVAEALGLGVLEPLLADEAITEIMINGPTASSSSGSAASSWPRSGSSAPSSCSRRSTASSPRSTAGSTSPARWSTPACAPASGST